MIGSNPIRPCAGASTPGDTLCHANVISSFHEVSSAGQPRPLASIDPSAAQSERPLILLEKLRGGSHVKPSQRKMTLDEWRDAVLKYYFARTDDADGPVKTLSVTPWDFARAAGEPVSEGRRLQREFMDAVRCEVGVGGGLLDAATNYDAFRKSWLPQYPEFLPYLIFSALAAAEMGGEEDLEDGYWASFKNIAEPCQVLGGQREWLPELWENLRTWLADKPLAYRGLELPDPGGFTVCGYSVKLAFPHGRDADRLEEALRDARLPRGYPTEEAVLQAIRPRLGQFRKTFRETFQAFEAEAEPSRRTHPFWCAVLMAKHVVDATWADAAGEAGGEISPRTSDLLLAHNDDDVPEVVAGLPEGFADELLGEAETDKMDMAADVWPRCLKSPPEAPERLLEDPPAHLKPSHRRMIGERFIPLVQVGGDPLWSVARESEVLASSRVIVHR